MTVFVDAGGWLSVMIATDQHDEAGNAYFGALIDLRALIVTTDFVLDEVISRLRYDVGYDKAAAFLTLLHGAIDGGAVKVHRITEDLWNEAEAIFLRYGDARLSFTDCTSFAWLLAQPVDEVFGFDAHFEMMGQILQPKH